jgi:phosphoribosyl 1,2-cyclic phosphate phosphodiesterase
MTQLRYTILGCGSSGGVPRPALGWGMCDPDNPKNRRRRTSLLVERRSELGVTRVLVDTSPDLREQLLEMNVDWLDAVLYTHEHADHCHGIDDLRGLFLNRRKRVPIWADERTSAVLNARFGYCFVRAPGSEYPPMLRENRMTAYEPVVIEGEGGSVTALPFLQQHGTMTSLGFRFGGLGYSCDLSGMPPESQTLLAGIDTWIVDALRDEPHPSHLSVSEALDWIARVRPRRAILTNLHTDLDYEDLRRRLPAGVEPAYDGLTIELPAD